MSEGAQLPDHPILRQIADVMEQAEIAGEIYDDVWRMVFVSTELGRLMGVGREEIERFYGLSPIARSANFPEWRPDRESAIRFWEMLGPSLVHDVPADSPDFDDVFRQAADRMREVDPAKPPPTALTLEQTFPNAGGIWRTYGGIARFTYHRLYDRDGTFLGHAMQTQMTLRPSLITRLIQGDPGILERMDRLREPERRSAAILFADLAASAELSRRLSSRAYFRLIRSLTDLIDQTVATRGGILGKHAGDGASALFLSDEAGDARAARSAIETGRAIRDEARGLAGDDGPRIEVKVAVHWGATLTVGQVSTRGRLEVTALGDEMNETARIESVAEGGVLLASKSLVERLDPDSAAMLGIDLDELSYRTVAELSDSPKAIRDAGTIAVAAV